MKDIGKTLDTAHSHICKAGFYIISMIVKRRFSTYYLKEAKYHLAKAQQSLGELNDRSKHS